MPEKRKRLFPKEADSIGANATCSAMPRATDGEWTSSGDEIKAELDRLFMQRDAIVKKHFLPALELVEKMCKERKKWEQKHLPARRGTC